MAVLVVAIVALSDPQGGGKQAGSNQTVSAPPSTSTVPTHSPSTSAHSPTSGHAAPTKSGTSAPSTSSATPSSGESSALIGALPLLVLNNTSTTGLAAQAATRFRSGGWTATYGNLPNEDILSTCAYYDPSVSNAKAVALALQQQYPTIKRVRPKFSGLPAGPIVVVLTPDYSSS